MNITIDAVVRTTKGKGASRRLRRENQIPSIVYGGGKAPSAIALDKYQLSHALCDTDIYTSMIDLKIGAVRERVLIKGLARHPVRSEVMHVDFQRVNENQTITAKVPVHIIGAEGNQALRTGAVLNQFLTAIEVSCLAKNLPHALDVDVGALELGDSVRLSQLSPPEGVVIIALQHEDREAHDQAVLAITVARKMADIEEETVETPSEEEADKEEGEDKSDKTDGEE